MPHNEPSTRHLPIEDPPVELKQTDEHGFPLYEMHVSRSLKFLTLEQIIDAFKQGEGMARVNFGIYMIDKRGAEARHMKSDEMRAILLATEQGIRVYTTTY